MLRTHTLSFVGGIAGQVFGSVNFKEGQRFETSPIVKGDIENGNIVQTTSGSRYFLSDKSIQEMKKVVSKNAQLPKELLSASNRATIQLTRKAKQEETEKAIKVVEKASPGITISLSSIFGFGEEVKNKSNPPKTAMKPVTKSAPSNPEKTTTQKEPGTISLESIFNMRTSSVAKKVSQSPQAPVQKRKVPAGVPTIERWKVEKDRAVTGFIRGSNQFRDGEKITTSSISKGNLKSGEVIVTASGTRYFLK
jgi:hypothetical protein